MRCIESIHEKLFQLPIGLLEEGDGATCEEEAFQAGDKFEVTTCLTLERTRRQSWQRGYKQYWDEFENAESSVLQRLKSCYKVPIFALSEDGCHWRLHIMIIGLYNYMGAGFEKQQQNKGGLRKLVTKLLFQTNPQTHVQDSETLPESQKLRSEISQFSISFSPHKDFLLGYSP